MKKYQLLLAASVLVLGITGMLAGRVAERH
jgi:hypothetical protein